MKRKKEKSEKNIITAIKALINNGEELTEDEIPEWHRPEWREWMKRRARSVERREGYITMNDQTSRKRKDKMNVSGSAYRAVPGLSWNKTNQGQEPLDRITEEKMNTDGVRRVQDGEKETKALRTATERSRIVATKVRSKPHINDLKEGPNY
ncbi:hypothetical protein BU16DRAFT_530320 [Lophium mytilinum]|uniref:Uncharacterized protein n=1 Tax=Lophium mytilinum TaxID=390894 RepID=A0A6A6QHJ4_9PEZI|nr:hypothetical protein BU16DRAFT_530320 [Lophium mytilinum]